MSRSDIGRSGVPKVDPINEAQAEALNVLKEECAELIQAASKMERCGQGFLLPTEGKLVRDLFSQEVGDVLLLIDEALQQGLIDRAALEAHLQSKPSKLYTWTHGLGSAPHVYAKTFPSGASDSDAA